MKLTYLGPFLKSTEGHDAGNLFNIYVRHRKQFWFLMLPYTKLCFYICASYFPNRDWFKISWSFRSKIL